MTPTLKAKARSLRPLGPNPAAAWRGYRLFYSQFRDHFAVTGAIAPSGAALAHAITAPLAQAPPGPLRVLEVGAGTGVFTREILRHLAAGDRLDVYEINPAFRLLLQTRREEATARGIRCQVHLAGICQLPPEAHYDFIVSGLPLNNFAPAEVETILELFMSHLQPGGVLTYFEYLYIRGLKRALVQNPAERARLRAVGAVVDAFLRRHRSESSPVPLNLPPAVVRKVWCGVH